MIICAVCFKNVGNDTKMVKVDTHTQLKKTTTVPPSGHIEMYMLSDLSHPQFRNIKDVANT